MEDREVVGLIPAGGLGRRIGPAPCSKEIYPVGLQKMGPEGIWRPKVACHFLLERMLRASVRKVFVVLRHGKWDIPSYLSGGSTAEAHLGYLVTNSPFGVPYTLDEAYPFVKDAVIAFGFPDILFEPATAFVELLARQQDREADVVLGLFPARRPENEDLVDVDRDQRVMRIEVKPDRSELSLTWIIATWTPRFTAYMHEFVATASPSRNRETFVGDVLSAAIDDGLHVDSVALPQATFVDVGTPEGLLSAIRSQLPGS